MNHKQLIRLISAFLFAAGILTLSACGVSPKLDNPYPMDAFSPDSAYGSEDGLRAAGFAAALCVPEQTEGTINAEGVTADSFALFDVTDARILSQNNLFEKMYPASTTKILTCLLALEQGNLEDVVTVPEDSAITVSGSSMANLKPGDQIKLRDLLYGLMVPSGNDAAVAIAKHIGGSVSKFVDMMNERAASLGASHSHFMNPHGLPDENHYTTVYDMYLIFNAALQNPDFAKIASTKEYTAEVTSADGTVREVSWSNGNAYLSGRFSMPDGYSVTAGKTGHTNAAGFCLVLGEQNKEGKQFISIIMKAPAYEALYNSMTALIEKGSTE